jgi:hypothetical protein
MDNASMLAFLNAKHLENYLANGADYVIRPMFLGVDRSENILAIPALWSDEIGKVVMCATISAEFKERGVTQYAFISESWAAVMSTIPTKQHEMPCNRTDRKEIIVTLVVDKNGKETSALELVRDWNTGKVVELKPWGPSSGGSYESIFAELL